MTTRTYSLSGVWCTHRLVWLERICHLLEVRRRLCGCSEHDCTFERAVSEYREVVKVEIGPDRTHGRIDRLCEVEGPKVHACQPADVP